MNKKDIARRCLFLLFATLRTLLTIVFILLLGILLGFAFGWFLDNTNGDILLTVIIAVPVFCLPLFVWKMASQIISWYDKKIINKNK